jgi:hypothetical protein
MEEGGVLWSCLYARKTIELIRGYELLVLPS